MSSIDEYDLGQPLGRGAFATVYRARNRKSGKAVAIKVCERPPHDDQNWEMRMKNEISIHSQLRHPNVVALFNCFEDNTRVYLVLELCEGGNLYQCLRENGPLGEQLAIPIIQQLTNALNCIQSHGIMHRDLKLSNILLTGDLHDPNTIVKLCDFGLACRKEHPDEEHFTFCGTPNYIAPEIVSNNSHDLPADLWSLGCLFYTMVVGFPPFERDEKEEIFMRIKTGIYEEPTDVMSENGLILLRSLLELVSLHILLFFVAGHARVLIRLFFFTLESIQTSKYKGSSRTPFALSHHIGGLVTISRTPRQQSQPHQQAD